MENQSPEHSCLNCGATYTGHFCPECGQSSGVKRLTIKETLADFFSASFALQGPLIQTTKLLALNPGKVFREFNAGKRKTYYKPVAYFILTTAIYLIIRALMDYDPLKGEFVDNNPDEMMSHGKEAAYYMVKNINNILFVQVFAIALTMKIFYWKRYYFAEYLSTAFYISGFYILFGLLVMFWNHYTDLRYNEVQLLFLILYTIYACRSFFQLKKFGSYLKYILIALMSLMLYMFLGYGLCYLIVAFIN